MTQLSFAALDLLRRYGCRRAVGDAAWFDRAILSQGRKGTTAVVGSFAYVSYRTKVIGATLLVGSGIHPFDLRWNFADKG